MPTYQYHCTKCDETFEQWQSITDDALRRHRGCGGKLTKVLGSVGIVLKGSGFYRNDSRPASRPSKRPEKTDASPNGSGPSSSSSSESSGSSGSKEPEAKSA